MGRTSSPARAPSASIATLPSCACHWTRSAFSRRAGELERVGRTSGGRPLRPPAVTGSLLHAVLDGEQLNVLAGARDRDRLQHADARLVELVLVLGLEQGVVLRLQ